MAKYTWDHVHLKTPDPEGMAQWFEKMLGAEVVRPCRRASSASTSRSAAPMSSSPKATGTIRRREIPYRGLEHFGLTGQRHRRGCRRAQGQGLRVHQGADHGAPGRAHLLHPRAAGDLDRAARPQPRACNSSGRRLPHPRDQLGDAPTIFLNQRLGVLVVAPVIFELGRGSSRMHERASLTVASNAARSAATRRPALRGLLPRRGRMALRRCMNSTASFLPGGASFEQRRHVGDLALALQHELRQQPDLLLGDPVRSGADEVLQRRCPTVQFRRVPSRGCCDCRSDSR